MCVPIFVYMDVTSASVCVISLCVSICEFFCLVKHVFHSCGVTCHSLCFGLNGSECMRLCPVMSCCLFACFTLPCVSIWPGTCFFFSVIYISLCLHLWVSLAASECLWRSVSHSVCIFVCIFLCEPPPASHCISIVAVSEFVLDGMHISFCISPFISLFVPVGMVCLWVCVCLSLAPIYVCITEWLSHCVHYPLSVSLFSMPVGE